MAYLQIKKYYHKVEDDDIVFHPVISDIHFHLDTLDVVLFRNKNTLRINRKMWDYFIKTVSKEVFKQLRKKGGKK